MWTAAADKDPIHAPAAVMEDIHRMFALLREGKRAEARQQIDAAQKRHAGSPHFHLMRGEQAARSRNFDAAEQAYRRAYELAPKLFVTSLNLARFYEFRKNNARARRFYRIAVEQAPKRASAWDFLAAHQLHQGQIDDALEGFRKAETLDARQPLAEVRLAELSARISDYIGARRWYKTALTRAKTGRNPIRIALSDAQMRLGLIDEARAEIERVLKSEEVVPLLVARGYIHESQGEPEEAERRYRRAITLDPGNVVAGNNLAMLLVRREKAPKEALALAESARKMQPRNGSVLGTYAVALAHAGKRADALTALAQAVRVTPGDAWVRYFYGKTLLQENRADEAKVHLEASLVLDRAFPRKEEVQNLLRGKHP